MSANNYIIIAYAPDNNYVDITAVSIQSAIENSAPHKARIFILYSDLSEENIAKLKDVTRAGNAEITFAKINAQEFEKFTLSDWVTVQAWFRTKLPDLFPELDKILYLDCDTLVAAPLEELWNAPIDGLATAVVRDIWNVEKYSQRLDLKSMQYFNSGMMLINCKYWRENKIFEQIRQYACTHKVEYCDQDTLNKIIDEKKLMLPMKFNYLEPWWREGYHEYNGEYAKPYAEAQRAPVIIHFTGPKPNRKGCEHSFAPLWWEYANRTPIAKSLRDKFENSTPPKEKRVKFARKIFSVSNEFFDGKKQKILRILGLKIKLGAPR